MRLGALVPALAFGAALVAAPPAGADHHRSSDRGRSGYERSRRGGDSRGHERGYRKGYRRGHSHGHRRDYRHGRRHYYHHGRRHYYHAPRFRSHRRYYGPRYYRPAPPVYYAPPYGYAPPRGYGYPGPTWGRPPYRGGVHGSVSVGLPFFALSLHF